MTSKILNHALLTPSPSSPDQVVFRTTTWSVSDHDEEPHGLGRRVRYEPVLVLTPVVASQRIQEQDGGATKRLITADDVDALTAQLEALWRPRGADDDTDPPTQGPSVQRTRVSERRSTTTPSDAASDATPWGRSPETVFSHKAQADVWVTRSRRCQASS